MQAMIWRFREPDPTQSLTVPLSLRMQANYLGLHSFPSYVNQVNTAILRIIGGNDDLSITTTVHPMPRKACLGAPAATSSAFLPFWGASCFSSFSALRG